MKTTPRFAILVVVALTFAAGLPALAEVTVRTDRDGQYLMTHVIPAGSQSDPQVWAQGRYRAARFGGHPLNVDGDRNGDLWPTVAESPLAPHHPLVAWSKFNGQGYNLAWSRWTDAGWDPVRHVSLRRAPGNDFDPFLVFGVKGRAFMVWWRDQRDGVGEIYLSMFLQNRWSTPVLVSDPDLDARYPTLEIGGRRELQLTYKSGNKTVQQTIFFSVPPGTITDDINPTFTLSGTWNIAPKQQPQPKVR